MTEAEQDVKYVHEVIDRVTQGHRPTVHVLIWWGTLIWR